MQVVQGRCESISELMGALDINTVGDIRSALLAYLEQNVTIVIDLSSITSCDAAGAQLLPALAKSAALAGKPFTVTAPSEAMIRDCANLGIDLVRSMAIWSSTGGAGELDVKKPARATKTKAAVLVGEMCDA